ncbi:MAG: PorP/SprF family type IX secretion system membrane protein [Weeksellaceae bacterium]|nr:PorP/SprF family type IX secretion system membrane protein [Weeksellaceae bacterium]
MNLKYFKLTGLALFMGFGILQAQQSIPVYEQYFTQDAMIINPSMVGIGEDIKFSASHRRQWQSLPNGPNTTIVALHGNVIDRLGLGMYFAGDENGNTRTNSFNVAASYYIPIGNATNREDGQFGFGTSLSFTSYRFGGVTEMPNDPLYVGETSIFIPYINFGGTFQLSGWTLAASVLDIPLSYNSPIIDQVEPNPVYYYAMLGKRFRVAEAFELEPVVLYRQNSNERRMLDGNLRARVYSGENSFWIGGTYRYDMSGEQSEGLTISPSLGASLGRFNLGFAYNIGLTDIAHEGQDGWSVNLGYDIDNFFRPNRNIDFPQ